MSDVNEISAKSRLAIRRYAGAEKVKLRGDLLGVHGGIPLEQHPDHQIADAVVGSRFGQDPTSDQNSGGRERGSLVFIDQHGNSVGQCRLAVTVRPDLEWFGCQTSIPKTPRAPAAISTRKLESSSFGHHRRLDVGVGIDVFARHFIQLRQRHLLDIGGIGLDILVADEGIVFGILVGEVEPSFQMKYSGWS